MPVADATCGRVRSDRPADLWTTGRTPSSDTTVGRDQAPADGGRNPCEPLHKWTGNESTHERRRLRVSDPQHLRSDVGYPRGDHPLTRELRPRLDRGQRSDARLVTRRRTTPSISGRAPSRRRADVARRRPRLPLAPCPPPPSPAAARAPEEPPRCRPTAVDWLVGEQPARVLDLGSGRGAFAATLVDAGHEVFCLDHDPERVARSPPGSAPACTSPARSSRCRTCPATSTSSPRRRRCTASPPGLAVTEIARVLRPGGHLAVVYQTRDDTVPWVRRLMGILQRVDPSAMQGAYGDASVAEVGESPYFRGLERRDFRTWVPTTREGLRHDGRAPPGRGRAAGGGARGAARRGRRPLRLLRPRPRAAAAARSGRAAGGRRSTTPSWRSTRTRR